MKTKPVKKTKKTEKLKKIEIILKPQDFENVDFQKSSDCALARATNRYFKRNDAEVDPSFVDFWDINERYRIKDNFEKEDFEFVKNQYKKDPKMLKARYVVTLIADF